MSNRGKVKFYRPDKGYGFLTAAGGAEIFVHRTGIVNGVSLPDGAEVTYDEATNPKSGKRCATNVRVVDGPVRFGVDHV